MELALIFIGAFFAILGGFALLNETAERLQKPRIWTELNHKRRFLIILVASFFLSIIRGQIYLFEDDRRKKNEKIKKEVLSVLYEYDTRLTQMDGLIQLTITSAQRDAPLSILNELAMKIAVYGSRMKETGPEAEAGPQWGWGPLISEEINPVIFALYAYPVGSGSLYMWCTASPARHPEISCFAGTPRHI